MDESSSHCPGPQMCQTAFTHLGKLTFYEEWMGASHWVDMRETGGVHEVVTGMDMRNGKDWFNIKEIIGRTTTKNVAVSAPAPPLSACFHDPILYRQKL